MIITDNKLRIKDIAKLANISPGTVDRVLHNRGEVKEETRAKVLKIIDELGYTPNMLAKSLALKKTFKICVLIPDTKNGNPYWEKPLEGINLAFNEIKDFNTIVDIFTYSIDIEADFEEKFNQIIDITPDGIICTPHFVDVTHKYIDKCKIKNIPVVFIDSNIEADEVLGFYGQDATSSGFIAAHLMSYGLIKKSTVLILKLATNKATFPHLMKREEGFLSFFKQNPQFGIKTLSFEIDLFSETESSEKLAKLLKETPKLGGLFVANSRVHKVAKAVKENNSSHLLLIGYDLIKENVKYLNEGVIDFLICQKPEEQGYRSVMAMFNYILLHKSIERINYSPIDIIMKENIDFYKKLLK